MKKVTTLLSTLRWQLRWLLKTFHKRKGNISPSGRTATIWLNGTSFVPTDAIPANGRKSAYLPVGNCKASALISMESLSMESHFLKALLMKKVCISTNLKLPAEKFRGKQVNLVFEASMTDTEVKVNGRKVGSKHQGAFYRFSYNVSGFPEIWQKECTGSHCRQRE